MSHKLGMLFARVDQLEELYHDRIEAIRNKKDALNDIEKLKSTVIDSDQVLVQLDNKHAAFNKVIEESEATIAQYNECKEATLERLDYEEYWYQNREQFYKVMKTEGNIKYEQLGMNGNKYTF